MDMNIGQTDTEAVVAPAKPKAAMAPRYRVILLNDDFTPMDFVVDVLQQFFFMDYVAAVEVMLEVHHKGVGVCGIFTRDVAETKVALVSDYAQQHEYPLLCKMEKLDTQ
jgi:ATP-dependent Clp protease adaptor protein ClpS